MLASGNPGKLREIARLLADRNITLMPQSELGVEDVAETGTTFVENALQKARNAAAATGLPAIADDSGLTVDALGGRPGVHSARYAGPDADDDANIDKLLRELEGVLPADRGASFHCVLCLVTPDDEAPLVASGEWRGAILETRQGSGGFGYDPVFLDPELGVSAAELTAEQKNQRSHRGKALRQLAQLIGSE